MTQKQGIMSYSEQSCWLIIRVHTFTEHGGKGGKKREREKRLIKSLGVPGVALVRVVVGWWQIDPFRPLWKNTTVDDATNPFPLIFLSWCLYWFKCLYLHFDASECQKKKTLHVQVAHIKRKPICNSLHTFSTHPFWIPPPFFFLLSCWINTGDDVASQKASPTCLRELGKKNKMDRYND